MTTKLVKWASTDGQIIKSGLSDGYGGKAITTAAHLDYDRHGFEGYPGNVGLMQIGHEWGQHMTQIWRFGGKIGDTTAAARVLNPALLNGRKPVDIPASLRQVPTIMSAREDTMGIGAVEFRSRSAAQSAERSGRATKTLLTSLAVGMALAAGSQAQASVRAAIVLDQNTGRIYKSFNANVLHKPASLTKMMSLYLVFDALKAGRLRLNQWVRVSYRAASRPPSKMYLRAGQRITIRKLIYGMAVKSANDAATAAAEAVAGSEAAFARMMTMKARELGMYRTVFRTASGLPARGQITTAKDMAILARALRRDHPRYYKVFSARYFRHAGRSYANTNRLLHRYGVIDGLKTGYTRRARYNLATSATNGRKRVVVVVLGATSSWERYRVTRNLLAYAWRARPYGSYVVARAARNHFRNRSRRTRMIAMARAARRKPINRTARKSATARNTANNIGANVAIHKKTLATRRAERRRNRIQLGTGRAYSAVTRRPVITYRRENVLHLGNYKRLRTASRKAIRAYRRLPSSYRRGAKVRIAVVRTRRGRLYRAQIAHVRARRTRTACRYLSRRGTRCRIITYKVRTLSSGARAAWRGRRTPAKRTRAAVRRASSGSGYAIQVVASRKFGLARKAVRKARRALPRSLVRGTRVAVLRPSSYRGRLYRGRIVGLSKRAARNACRILAGRKLRCMTIRHKA